MALLGDGQSQEHTGRDGHVTYDITDREQHPENMIMISQTDRYEDLMRFILDKMSKFLKVFFPVIIW